MFDNVQYLQVRVRSNRHLCMDCGASFVRTTVGEIDVNTTAICSQCEETRTQERMKRMERILRDRPVAKSKAPKSNRWSSAWDRAWK